MKTQKIFLLLLLFNLHFYLIGNAQNQIDAIRLSTVYPANCFVKECNFGFEVPGKFYENYSDQVFPPHPDSHSDVIRGVLPLSTWRGVAVSSNVDETVGVRWDGKNMKPLIISSTSITLAKKEGGAE